MKKKHITSSHHHILTSYRAGVFFRKTERFTFPPRCLVLVFWQEQPFHEAAIPAWDSIKVQNSSFCLTPKTHGMSLVFCWLFSVVIFWKNPSWINKKKNPTKIRWTPIWTWNLRICFRPSKSSRRLVSEQLKGGNILNQKQHPAGSGFTSFTSGSCHAPWGPWPGHHGQQICAKHLGGTWTLPFLLRWKYTYVGVA